MKSFSALFFLFTALLALTLVGCGGQQPAAPTAAQPATTSKPAETEKKAEPSAEPAAPPIVAATEQKPEAESPTVKIDQQGKAVVMSFGVVYFDFDKYNIKPEFEQVIKLNAEALKGNPSLKVVIEGHCDERGSTEYNLALGQRRATAVLQALRSNGVPASQLKTISYGKERPVDLGHTEEAWAKNRRSVITNGQGRE